MDEGQYPHLRYCNLHHKCNYSIYFVGYYNSMKIQFEQKDKELVTEYWTKIDEKEKVFDLPAVDARYFY